MFTFLYIDPSVASAGITAIAAAAVTIGASVVLLVRKAKKKVAEKLNIDENANKEVEAEVEIIEDEAEEETV